MMFFIRQFRPSLSDENLWENLTRKKTIHLPVDNQYTMIRKFTESGTAERTQALEAAQTHADFTSQLATYTDTCHILCKPEDPRIKYEWRLKLQNEKLPYSWIYHDPDTLQAVSDPDGLEWIDAVSPEACNGKVFFKEYDDAFSHHNENNLSCALGSGKIDTVVVSGFFSNICVIRTVVGANKNKFETIVDPETIFNSADYKPGIGDDRRIWDLYRNICTTMTEPGQISHVMQQFGTPLVQM